jgi:hypothetical protein
MHRWVWDLHYPAPTSTHRDYPIAAVPHDTGRAPLGPRVLPGQYTIRLTANGHTYTAPLTVKMDPRVKTSAAGLQQMFQLETRLAGMMNQVADAVLQARSIRDQLKKAPAGGPVADALHSFQQKLTAIMQPPDEPGSTPAPTLTGLNGAVGALYDQVGHADAAPTGTQVSAAAAVERDFTDVMRRWTELWNRDLPALNQQLKSAGSPEIQPEKNTASSNDAGDED